MHQVKHLLASKASTLFTIGPDAPVLEAIKHMAEHRVGALLVMRDNQLLGLVSERDYARKVILFGKSSRDTAVREIMTEKLVCVRPTATINECMAIMTEKRIRHLPVLEGTRVKGVISIGDAVKETIAEQQLTIEQLESYIMG